MIFSSSFSFWRRRAFSLSLNSDRQRERRKETDIIQTYAIVPSFFTVSALTLTAQYLFTDNISTLLIDVHTIIYIGTGVVLYVVYSHVEFLLLVIQLFALHAPLQQCVVLLTQQVDLTQEVVVLLFQIPFQSTQQLNIHMCKLKTAILWEISVIFTSWWYTKGLFTSQWLSSLVMVRSRLWCCSISESYCATDRLNSSWAELNELLSSFIRCWSPSPCSNCCDRLSVSLRKKHNRWERREKLLDHFEKSQEISSYSLRNSS